MNKKPRKIWIKKNQQNRKNYYEKNREKIGKNCMKKIKMEKNVGKNR